MTSSKNIMNLNLSVEEDKIILTLEEDSPDELMPLVEKFDVLTTTQAENFERVIRYGDVDYSLPEFKQFLIGPDVSVPNHQFRTLISRVKVLEEGFAKLSALLEKRPQLPAPDEKKTNSNTRKMQHKRLAQWWNRYEAGEEKVIKIMSIFEHAGIHIERIAESGNVRFGNARPGYTRCVAAVEQIYDKYGEKVFIQIVNTIGSMEGIELRNYVWAAADYAIGQKGMSPEAFYGPAIDYFTMDKVKLDRVIHRISDAEQIRKVDVIGRLVTGELNMRNYGF